MAKRLITGLFVALLVSCVFTFWLSKKFAKPVAAAPVKVQYVAAAKSLDAGEVLSNDDLARQDALQDAQQDAADDDYADDSADDAGDYSDDGGMDTA